MDLSSGKRLIGDLKSKLGLGGNGAGQGYDQAYDDAYYEDGYDGYADGYGEGYPEDYGYGYDEYDEFGSYGRGYADEGYGYDDGYGYPPEGGYRDPRRGNAGTRARNVGRDARYSGGYREAPSAPMRGRPSAGMPRLLTIDEVRDRTRASRQVRAEAPSGSFLDERDRAPRAASAPLPRRSGNFDSMPVSEPLPEQPIDAHSGRFLSLLDSAPGSPNADVSRIRALTVLKPMRYGEAERITEALKKGDVAVLDLREAPKGLDKRILDFSFGAANVLDASVECVADKVFVVCAGGSLTQTERSQLQSQGII